MNVACRHGPIPGRFDGGQLQIQRAGLLLAARQSGKLDGFRGALEGQHDGLSGVFQNRSAWGWSCAPATGVAARVNAAKTAINSPKEPIPSGSFSPPEKSTETCNVASVFSRLACKSPLRQRAHSPLSPKPRPLFLFSAS